MIELEPVVLDVPLDLEEISATETLYLVRVITEDEIAYGEALISDPVAFPAAVDFFAEAVAYANFLDFNLLWQRLNEHFQIHKPQPQEVYRAVLAAIDMAAWDLAGRKLGVPCYRLLGGRRSGQIDCYAGGLWAGQENLERTALKLRQQFSAVELRLSGELDRDIAVIRQIRRLLGEEACLMIDASGLYESVEEAREIGSAVVQAEGFWLENPLPAGFWPEYALLRETLDTGIAGGRTLSSYHDYLKALQAGALDVALADLRLCGGLSAGRCLADETSRFGVRLSFHCAASPLALLAAAHLAAAYWHIGPLHVRPFVPPLEELISPPLQFVRGFLQLPTSPGLGGTVQEVVVEHYQIA